MICVIIIVVSTVYYHDTNIAVLVPDAALKCASSLIVWS